MNSPLARQTLILDADDTLWEYNIYFEAAFDRFVNFLGHEHLTSSEVQEVLDTFQRANLSEHGYGARSFARSLRDTFQHVSGVEDGHPDLDKAESLGLEVLTAPFLIIDGVEETLRALRVRHTLYMLTKGHLEEQQAKIDRSGLGAHFTDMVVTSEKHVDTYRQLMQDFSLNPANTWMIGNSPRSDVNPALLAGMNAVLVPHPRTWHLESKTFSFKRVVLSGCFRFRHSPTSHRFF